MRLRFGRKVGVGLRCDGFSWLEVRWCSCFLLRPPVCGDACILTGGREAGQAVWSERPSATAEQCREAL